MRFPSGVTDQYISFQAVSTSDYVTALSSFVSTDFTVYRARNGSTGVAYTTPTFVAPSSVNMAGLYWLLLDEDMTIGTGNDEEECLLRITASGMAPVSLKFDLYRPKMTEGNTLLVSTAGALGTGAIVAGSFAAGAIDASAIATDAIGAAELAADAVAEIVSGVWGSTTTRLLTAGTNIVLAKGTGVTGFNDLSTADIRTALGMAAANLDTQLGAIPTTTEIAALLWGEAVPGAYIAGSAGYLVGTYLDAAVSAIPTSTELAALVWGESVPGAYSTAAAGGLLGTNLDAAITSRLSSTAVAFTVAGQIDANVQYVNDVAVGGTGTSTNPWGPV